jgi:hypothetical protein
MRAALSITPKTTLAELQRILHALDDPFVTAMVGPNNRYSVILHLQGPGAVSGIGDTVAEAFADAVTRLDAVLNRYVGGN